jgi:hypothetical protein
MTQINHRALHLNSRAGILYGAAHNSCCSQQSSPELLRCNRIVVEAMARPTKEQQPAASESPGSNSPTSSSDADPAAIPSDAATSSVTSDPTTERPTRKNEQHRRVTEIGGPKGPEPTRYGDWEKGGRCIDF